MNNRFFYSIFGVLFSTAASSANLENLSMSTLDNVEALISSRFGFDRDKNFSLEEYRGEVSFGTNPAPQWRTQVKAGYVTERKLDRQPDSRLDVQNLYARYEGKHCGVNIGVQQVVWGKSDRLQVLDVIHPLDLRESYFGEWERKRLPLGMLNVECGNGEQSVQFLLVPQTRFDRLPSSEGRFAQPGVGNRLVAQGVPVIDDGSPSTGKPSDWSGGLQWSGKAGEADVTLNAYEGWQSQERFQPDGMFYRKTPARFQLIGGSYTRPVGPFVTRLEAARTYGVTGYTQGTAGQALPVSLRQTSYLFGADYLSEPWFISAQMLQRRQDTDTKLVTPGFQRTLTFAVRRSFMQDRLHVNVFTAWDRAKPASYMSLLTTYELTSQLLLKANVEHFRGNMDSFGLFSPQNRMVIGFEYHFR